MIEIQNIPVIINNRWAQPWQQRKCQEKEELRYETVQKSDVYLRYTEKTAAKSECPSYENWT